MKATAVAMPRGADPALRAGPVSAANGRRGCGRSPTRFELPKKKPIHPEEPPSGGVSKDRKRALNLQQGHNRNCVCKFMKRNMDAGAGSGNRTRIFSLEGCCTTIVLYPLLPSPEGNADSYPFIGKFSTRYPLQPFIYQKHPPDLSNVETTHYRSRSGGH